MVKFYDLSPNESVFTMTPSCNHIVQDGDESRCGGLLFRHRDLRVAMRKPWWTLGTLLSDQEALVVYVISFRDTKSKSVAGTVRDHPRAPRPGLGRTDREPGVHYTAERSKRNAIRRATRAKWAHCVHRGSDGHRSQWATNKANRDEGLKCPNGWVSLIVWTEHKSWRMPSREEASGHFPLGTKTVGVCGRWMKPARCAQNLKRARSG